MIKFYEPSGESHFGQATITRTTSVNGGLSLTGELFAGDDVLTGLDYGWWLNFDNEKYVITYKKLSDDTNTIVFDAVQQFFWDFAKVALHSQYTGSHTYDFYLGKLFSGSGYTYQNDATVPAFEKENWGYKNKLSLFNDIIDQADVEFEVHNEIVHIAKQIGSDLTSFVRKGINLSDLTEEMKISDFATYAKGYGAFNNSEDPSKGRLEVEYRSELADSFGDLEMDPIVDERYTVADNLIAELKKQVDATYTVSMTMNIYDLENAGYPNYESPKVGDWILAIDEALNFKRKIRIIKLEEQFDATGKRIGYTATCGDLNIVDQYMNIQGSLDSKIQRIQRSVDDVAISANGKSSNYYGAKEPASADDADLWFDQSDSDPDKWSIKQWANGRWEQLTLNPGEVDGKVSVAKQAADTAIVNAADALDKFNNMQVGGRNLYFDTKDFNNLDLWYANQYWTKQPDKYNGLAVMETTDSWDGISQYVKVKTGEVYTFSLYARYTSGTGKSTIYWQLDFNPESGHAGANASPANKTVNLSDSWQRISVTTTITVDGYIRPKIKRTADNDNILQIAGMKLERGNVATDWSPAPEDQATVADVSSQITKLQSDINLRVQKGDVINQINISPESILIAGQKVHITGQTTIDNAVINDAMIASLSATKVNTGTLNAANVNVINLNASSITTGELTGIVIKGPSLNINLATGNVDFAKGVIRSENSYWDLSEGGITLRDTTWSNRVSTKIDGGIIRQYNINGKHLAINGESLSYYKNSSYEQINQLKFSDDNVILTGPDGSNPGSWIRLNDKIYMQTSGASGVNGARFELGIDSGGPYVRSGDIYNRTSSDLSSVGISAFGTLGRLTSASKYKLDITPVKESISLAENVLKLEPKKWFDKGIVEQYAETLTTGKTTIEDEHLPIKRSYGLIAEDLEKAGLSMFCHYDNNGEVEGIAYDRLWTVLIPLIKDQQSRIDKLEKLLGVA